MRVLNEQMRGLERLLLLDEGLPGRPDIRHLITDSSKAFPGVVDLLSRIDHTIKDSDEFNSLLKQIHKHVSDVMIAVDRASDFLKPIGIDSETFILESHGYMVTPAHCLFIFALLSLMY